MKDYAINTEIIETAIVNDITIAPQETLTHLLTALLDAGTAQPDQTALLKVIDEYLDGHEERTWSLLTGFVRDVLLKDLRSLTDNGAIVETEKDPDDVIRGMIESGEIETELGTDKFLERAHELAYEYGDGVDEADVFRYASDMVDRPKDSFLIEYFENEEYIKVCGTADLGYFLSRRFSTEEAFELGRNTENLGDWSRYDDYFIYDEGEDALRSVDLDDMYHDNEESIHEWALREGLDDDALDVYNARDALIKAVRIIMEMASKTEE